MNTVEIRDMGKEDERYVGSCGRLSDDDRETESMSIPSRLEWYRNAYAEKGLRIKVAVLSGKQVGMVHIYPIETCPWERRYLIEKERVREVCRGLGDSVVRNEYNADDPETLRKYQIYRGIFINGREVGWGNEAPKAGIRQAIEEEDRNMRVAEIDAKTEGTFFRCLHDERPDNPDVTGIRRSWYEKFKPKGLRGKVLIAILCMWVHGYEHHPGNLQGKGYGRILLVHIEEDAKASGMKGVAVWGKDFPQWNPISFYEHMGYLRVDREGLNVLSWKPFGGSAEAPAIKRSDPPKASHDGKIVVTSNLCGWCGSEIQESLGAKEAVAGIVGIAEYSQIDMSSSPTITGMLYIDNMPYRPDGPPATVDELRNDINKLHKAKYGHKHRQQKP